MSQERIIFGINTVKHALASRAAEIVCVYLQDDLGRQRLHRVTDELRDSQVKVENVSCDALEQLTGTTKHQGVAAALRGSAPMDDGTALDFLAAINAPLILVLDEIDDPRNFGACLRTAEGAGVDLVVTGRSRGIAITPVVSKVASGAAETQAIAVVANIVRFIKELQNLNIWVIGADERGSSIYETDLKGPLALVMGAEGKGLRRLTREHCDALVSVPMKGSVESLNLSVAAGVCLYEALRQRS
jgi:23S rRNA (guanosine2251-2'-O)-methyltransferase